MTNSENEIVVYRWDGPPRIELTRRPVSRADGASYELHELHVQQGRPGAVIIAVSDQSILFVNHFRPALDQVVTELPRGFAELADVESLATGIREFSEELGMALINPHILGEYVLDTAIYPTRVGVVTGTVELSQTPTPTDGEINDWKLIPIGEVKAQIIRGEIYDGHTLSALAMFFASREGSG